MITLIPAPRGRKKRDFGGNPIPKTLTVEQHTFNLHMHSMRSRVENIFGQKFCSLNKPFWGGEEQLDYLVWFAAGLLNTK